MLNNLFIIHMGGHWGLLETGKPLKNFFENWKTTIKTLKSENRHTKWLNVQIHTF